MAIVRILKTKSCSGWSALTICRIYQGEIKTLLITLLNSLSIRIDNSYIRIILSYKLAHALSIATLITRKAAQIRKPSEKKVTRKDDKEKPGGGKEN